jgi:hypothetical protein
VTQPVDEVAPRESATSLTLVVRRVRFLQDSSLTHPEVCGSAASVFAMAGRPPKSDAQRSGIVEYGLVRHRLMESLRKGRVRREDVCDAHPELLRAAQHLGVRTERPCPICDAESTVEVTYVFGAKLPPGGTCPSSKAELGRLERREEAVVCYAVEACNGCGFHHLARKWQAGGRAPRRAARQRAQ